MSHSHPPHPHHHHDPDHAHPSAEVAPSLLRLSAAARLAGAVVLIALLWGAVFWTLVCGDVWLQANQPNAEVFINACVVWAFALLVRAGGRPRLWRALAIGGLFALASLYKPIAIAPAALLGLAHVVATDGVDADVRNGFDGIKVTYKIDADASPEDIKAIVAQSQKRSAVYDIITNPTNVTVEVA